jgi:type I restriction enzyme R subunit
VVRERYKDDTLDISDAGEKVKKLIDDYLISLGIDPKIPPVELLSADFAEQVEKNRSAKAKASEMEHAIRKHCNVHFDEDPAFYASLSEKLEALIRQMREDWDRLCEELGELRDRAKAGRKEGIDGVSAQAAPFYDLIGRVAFGKGGIPSTQAEAVKRLVADVVVELKGTIRIVSFWTRPPEVSRLKGRLSDLILFTGVDEIIAKSDKLVTEIAALARVRHQDLVD